VTAPRALLLDALGTLVRLEPPVAPLRRELRERFGLELAPEQVAAAVRAEIAFYRAHHDEARDAATLAELRQRSARALRDALPESAAELPLAPLTEALLAALRFSAFPEAPDVLRVARERGMRLVVVSNWDVSLHDVLAETGLAPLLDAVLTSAEVGSAKPDGAIFRRALAVAEVEAREALHVGDSVEHDVVGARAAGIPCVLVVRDGSPPPPGVPVVATLRDLLDPRTLRP
jgi:putative hydrolase of the HAD superfamily